MKKILLLLLLASPAFSSAQSLEDLDWMAGYWTSTQNGITIEELWTPASGNLMLGLHRDTFSNSRNAFEFLRIEQTDSAIVYLASPSGNAPTPFTLVSVEGNKAIFENLNHDFPQRIIYVRENDSLTARIENEAGDRSMSWTWTLTNFNPKK